MFAIGEKVVCISNLIAKLKPIDIEQGLKVPIQNQIYTVRNFGNTDEVDGSIRLEEIINPILQYDDGICEKAFYNYHFRKLDYDFAENLLSEITKQVKEEEKVLRLDKEQESQKHFSIVLKEIWKW